MNKIIAVVGMCGSGKSVVCDWLEKEGYQKYYSTIDEDSLTITENKNANTIYVYYEQKST